MSAFGGVMERILVVDDSATVLLKLARDIEAMGYEATTASLLDEALRQLRSSRPDLILLDLEMAPVSGVEVGRQLLEHDPTLPIVIHSSNATQTLIDAARTLRAVGIVRKGSGVDRLKAVIERSLRLSWSLNEHAHTEAAMSGLLGGHGAGR